jgi:hypothetical protein
MKKSLVKSRMHSCRVIDWLQGELRRPVSWNSRIDEYDRLAKRTLPLEMLFLSLDSVPDRVAARFMAKAVSCNSLRARLP